MTNSRALVRAGRNELVRPKARDPASVEKRFRLVAKERVAPQRGGGRATGLATGEATPRRPSHRARSDPEMTVK